VHDLTLAQVRTLDCGNPIATLPEVFALTNRYRADVRYDIETKVNAEQQSASATPDEFVDVC
jgi:glycerophosphoryl diester phosphodiesterase